MLKTLDTSAWAIESTSGSRTCMCFESKMVEGTGSRINSFEEHRSEKDLRHKGSKTSILSENIKIVSCDSKASR